MLTTPISLLGISLLVLGLSACSAPSTYNLGQGWRHNQCSQILDDRTRAQCFETAKQPYEQYRDNAKQ